MTVPRLGIDIAPLSKCWEGRPFWLIKPMQWLERTGRGRTDRAANVILVFAITRPLHYTVDRRWVLQKGSAALERAQFKGQIYGDPVGVYSSDSTRSSMFSVTAASRVPSSSSYQEVHPSDAYTSRTDRLPWRDQTPEQHAPIWPGGDTHWRCLHHLQRPSAG